MKLTRYLLGICLLVCSMQGNASGTSESSSVSTQKVFTKGIITIYHPASCGRYVSAYQQQLKVKDSSSYVAEFYGFVGYIKGFITAYNMTADNGKADIVAGTDLSSVYLFVNKFCIDNPLASPMLGIMEFVVEMEEGKQHPNWAEAFQRSQERIKTGVALPTFKRKKDRSDQ